MDFGQGTLARPTTLRILFGVLVVCGVLSMPHRSMAAEGTWLRAPLCPPAIDAAPSASGPVISGSACPAPQCPPESACPPSPWRALPPSAAPLPDDAAPEADQPPADAAPLAPETVPQPQPLFTAPQSMNTAATSPQSVAPNMIGDLFNLGGGGFDSLSGVSFPAPGSVVGRQKISENSSPLPRDRVFLNYSYFDNTPLTRGGTDVHRFTPGFEKTFLDGNASIEVRLPFASTLDSSVRVPTRTGEHEAELGNLTAYLKALLYDTPTFALSAGLGMTLPTADDARFLDAGTVLVKFDNESYHLLPFLGALYTPDERIFLQSFLQFDFDTNGNGVNVLGDGTGTLQDSTLVYFDVALGYWMYENFRGPGRIAGIATIFEVHYNGSVDGGDDFSAGGFSFGTGDNLDLVNAVFGLTTAFRNDSQLTLGYTLPVAGSDQQFDGELRVMYNLFFGSPSPSGATARRGGIY